MSPPRCSLIVPLRSFTCPRKLNRSNSSLILLLSVSLCTPQAGLTVNTDLKLTWLDAGLWLDLFREAGIRSPVKTLPCTPREMRKWLHRVDITSAQCCEYTGYRSLSEYQQANPRVPLFAFLGQMLEAKREGMIQESSESLSVPLWNCTGTVISVQSIAA